MHNINAVRLILVAVCWTGMSACGSVARRGADLAPSRLIGGETTTRSRAKIITAADLASVEAKSTIDAIRLLRPEFLRREAPRRAHVDGDLPIVYVNDLYGGGLEVLSTVPLRVIQEIHFLKAGEAGIRYGFQNIGAVILVRTWTGR